MGLMMSKLERYSSYKDSGVEWLGEIPSEWEVKKLKFVSSIIMGQSPENNEINQNQAGMAFLQGNAEFGKIFPIEKNWCSKPKKIALKNDILYSVRAPVGAVNLADKDYCIGRGLCSFREQTIYKDYLFYGSLLFKKEFDKFATGSTFEAISVLSIKNLKFALPPKQEQTKIASFLDTKTEQLDKAIKQKEQLIELLKERRQILINDAVTKGIDKTVAMKDSGVEWIGEIPEGWEVRRLASIGTFSKGGGISRDNLTEKGLSAILYGDIYTKYNFKTNFTKNFISKDTAKNAIKIIKGKLLLTGSGETKEDIGKCIVYTGDVDAYAGGDVIIFNQNKADSLFLGYSLNSGNSISQKMMMAKGEIIVHIYGSKLKELIIPLPPTKEEQQVIANYIEQKNNKINKAIDLQQQQITKLKEYKTTLIDSVVTGKVRVA